MRLITIIIGLLAMTGCQEKTDGYLIKGEFTGAPENGWVYLMNDNQRVYFDSVQLKQGQFEFRGKIENPELRSLVFFKDPSRRITGWADIMTVPVYLENSMIHVSVPFAEMPSKLSKEMPQSLRVEGSASHDLFQGYHQRMGFLSLQYQKVFDAYRKAYYRGKGTEKEVFSYIKELNVIRDSMYCLGVDFIREHGDSPVAVYVVERLASERYSKADAQKILELFPAQVLNGKSGKQIEQMLVGRPVYVNESLPEVKVQDAQLQLQKLSGFVKEGRYTLVELWASWCGPCRHDIPHLKETYKRFHEKGFDIVSVSIDDDTSKWKKALGEEGMPWTQVCGGLEAQKAFGVTGVPSGFLVGPDGKVINMNARGGWLNLHLAKLLEK